MGLPTLYHCLQTGPYFKDLGGTENGTWGAPIKIPRPLYNTNTPGVWCSTMQNDQQLKTLLHSMHLYFLQQHFYFLQQRFTHLQHLSIRVIDQLVVLKRLGKFS